MSQTHGGGSPGVLQNALRRLDRYLRWLGWLLYENLYFALSVPVVFLLLQVPQISTVITETVEVSVQSRETRWAILFLGFLVFVGAFCLASIFVVVPPQCVKESRAVPCTLRRWLPHWVFHWWTLVALASAVVLVVALLPLVGQSETMLSWIVPAAVVVLAVPMAGFVRWQAGWLNWMVGRRSWQWRLGVGVAMLVAWMTIVLWGAAGVGSRWYPLAGAICRQFGALFGLVCLWLLVSLASWKRGPNGELVNAPGRVLSWLVFVSCIGEGLWIAADLGWLGASYRLYTIWGILQTAALVVVLGAMVDDWQRDTHWPMRLGGLVVAALLFLFFGASPEALDSPTAAADSDIAADSRAERLRWYDHVITRLEALDPDEPAVIVAASGGGSRASIFTALVLEALAREPLGSSGKSWCDHIVLISGVSGGSLATAYYVHAQCAADPASHTLAEADDLRNSIKGELIYRMRKQARESLLEQLSRRAGSSDVDRGDDDLRAKAAELEKCLDQWHAQEVDGNSKKSCLEMEVPQSIWDWEILAQHFRVWELCRDLDERWNAGESAPSKEVADGWVLRSLFMDDMCTDFMGPILRGTLAPGLTRGRALRAFWTQRFGWQGSNSRVGYEHRGATTAAPGYDPHCHPAALFNISDVRHGTRVTVGFPPLPPELYKASYSTEPPGSIRRPRTIEEADPARRVALADAVELSANFPFGFNVVSVADQGPDEDGDLHLLDGGIVDNSGIDALFEVLRNARHISDSTEPSPRKLAPQPAQQDEYKPDDLAKEKCKRLMELLQQRRVVLLEIDSGAKPGKPGLFTRCASLLFEPLDALNSAGYLNADRGKSAYLGLLDQQFRQPLDLGDLLKELPGRTTPAYALPWRLELERTETEGIRTFFHVPFICNHLEDDNVLTAWSLGPNDKARLLFRFLLELKLRRGDLNDFRERNKRTLLQEKIVRQADIRSQTEAYYRYAALAVRLDILRSHAQPLQDKVAELAKKPRDPELRFAVRTMLNEQRGELERLSADVRGDRPFAELTPALDQAKGELDRLSDVLEGVAVPDADKVLKEFPKHYLSATQGLFSVIQQTQVANLKKGIDPTTTGTQADIDQRAKATREYFAPKAAKGR
jgi:predicted acylesterase/phospholipase RssA